MVNIAQAKFMRFLFNDIVNKILQWTVQKSGCKCFVFVLFTFWVHFSSIYFLLQDIHRLILKSSESINVVEYNIVI